MLLFHMFDECLTKLYSTYKVLFVILPVVVSGMTTMRVTHLIKDDQNVCNTFYADRSDTSELKFLTRFYLGVHLHIVLHHPLILR